MTTTNLSVQEYETFADCETVPSAPPGTGVVPKRILFETYHSGSGDTTVELIFEGMTGDVMLGFQLVGETQTLSIPYQNDLFREPRDINVSGGWDGPRTLELTIGDTTETNGSGINIVGPFNPLRFCRPDGTILVTVTDNVDALSVVAAFRPRFGIG